MTTNALEAAIPKLSVLAAFYDELHKKNGATPTGVAWRDEDSQFLRFEVLLQIVSSEDLHKGHATINDLGCGYGALFDYLKDDPLMVGSRYQGYDICESLLATAKRRHNDKRAVFSQSMVATEAADYSFVSGTFNMVADREDESWRAYICDSLAHLWRQSKKGLAFNLLDADQTSSEDRSDGLFYDKPGFYIDFCRQKLDAKVSLVNDYPLKEWTLLLRK